MPTNPKATKLLAENRRRRLQEDGCWKFGLTVEEVHASTAVAMRLADASKSQAEERHGQSLANSA